MKILLLGAPGSGKGTTSSILVAKHGFKHISTGNLFREILETDSDIAKKIKNFLYSGELVPDELTNELVKESIYKDIKDGTNLIFDGYPRNIDQAKFLSHICKMDLVFLLDVKDETILSRISGRRICPNCNTIYNINKDTLKNKNLCNKCNSILVQRKDDNLETIKNRLKVYNETSKDLENFYKNKGVLHYINGEDESSIIEQKILNILDGLSNDNN